MYHGLIASGLLLLTATGTEPRDDALALFGAALIGPGLASHCAERVGPSGDMDRARAAWERRHEAVMREVAAVVAATGGMPESVKGRLADDAALLVSREVEAAGGAASLCPRVPAAMDQGVFDLATMPEVRGAYARTMRREG